MEKTILLHGRTLDGFFEKDYTLLDDQRFFLLNEQPATHFIEVFTDGVTTNQQDAKECKEETNSYDAVYPINELTNVLKTTSLGHCKTIAVFKIRFKTYTN